MVWEYATQTLQCRVQRAMESLLPRNHAGRIPLGQPVGRSSRNLAPPERCRLSGIHTTRNNLYGFQIGADGKLFERGRFSIDGLVKAGIFDNDAERRPASASIKFRATSPPRPITPPSWAKSACNASIKLPRGFRSRPVTKRSGCKALLWRPARSRKPICLRHQL